MYYKEVTYFCPAGLSNDGPAVFLQIVINRFIERVHNTPPLILNLNHINVSHAFATSISTLILASLPCLSLPSGLKSRVFSPCCVRAHELPKQQHLFRLPNNKYLLKAISFSVLDSDFFSSPCSKTCRTHAVFNKGAKFYSIKHMRSYGV